MKDHDKLVRDDIPAIIREGGEEPTVDVVDGEAYRERLHDKLREEVAEFRAAPSADEAADVREVLDALLAAEGIEQSAVDQAREEKAQTRGRFEKGIVLKTVAPQAETGLDSVNQS